MPREALDDEVVGLLGLRLVLLWMVRNVPKSEGSREARRRTESCVLRRDLVLERCVLRGELVKLDDLIEDGWIRSSRGGGAQAAE